MPVAAPADVVDVVEIPRDIAAVRATDPGEAARWRLRVREEFAARRAEGLRVGGFDLERGYLFVYA